MRGGKALSGMGSVLNGKAELKGSDFSSPGAECVGLD